MGLCCIMGCVPNGMHCEGIGEISGVKVGANGGNYEAMNSFA